jgi:ribosomal protein S18 acetylase RimI-like enzyme
MVAGDVPAVAALHQTVFPGYFLTLLGQEFLELFYAQFVARAGNHGLVAKRDGRLLGFVVATSDAPALYRTFYRSHFLRLSWIVLRRLIMCAELRRSVATRAGHVRHAFDSLLRRPAPAQPGGDPTARLLSIGVHPEQRGQGIAEELVNRLCEELRGEGVGAVGLSVRGDNSRAIAFYRRTGWQQESAHSGALQFVRSTQRRQPDGT